MVFFRADCLRQIPSNSGVNLLRKVVKMDIVPIDVAIRVSGVIVLSWKRKSFVLSYAIHGWIR